ncbi:unnamed protein product [Cylicostephanus goldi]|uniref:RRM domain-containing protein n=1 Tax=Cylicostephanus goldi TaxID=71465 RepID=A0A3P7N219_CYLGO|nr:unnamed protein product [Cylicostephanus goldi]
MRKEMQALCSSCPFIWDVSYTVNAILATASVIGNISYEVPEDTIRQIFSKVGHVVHIKMVHDRETGKPKGYGFIEFLDVQTAELAIRNLNG